MCDSESSMCNLGYHGKLYNLLPRLPNFRDWMYDWLSNFGQFSINLTVKFIRPVFRPIKPNNSIKHTDKPATIYSRIFCIFCWKLRSFIDIRLINFRWGPLDKLRFQLQNTRPRWSLLRMLLQLLCQSIKQTLCSCKSSVSNLEQLWPLSVLLLRLCYYRNNLFDWIHWIDCQFRIKLGFHIFEWLSSGWQC